MGAGWGGGEAMRSANRRSRVTRVCEVAAAALLALAWAFAQSLAAPPKLGAMKLGYVELADDPRYANRGEHSGIVFTDLGRPYPGSQVALADAQAIGRIIGVEFSM